MLNIYLDSLKNFFFPQNVTGTRIYSKKTNKETKKQKGDCGSPFQKSTTHH